MVSVLGNLSGLEKRDFFFFLGNATFIRYSKDKDIFSG